MKLLGIIVNFRTPEMTMGAARALAAALQPIPSARFVIVDNHSQDGSLEQLQRAVAREPWSARCDVVGSGHNGGFGYGNNFAIRRSLSSADPAEYYYLLNSDAEPRVDAVRHLVDFMDSHPAAGIAGGYVHGPDGEPHQTAFRFPSLIADFEEQAQTGPISKVLARWIVPLPIPRETVRVDWTAGVSLIMRRSVLEQVGLFDEKFFLYFEETDLCRRAGQRGFPTYYVPDSAVMHIESATTGMTDLSRRMPRYWFDARQHYLRKHHGDAYLMGANLAWLLGRCTRGARRLLERRRDERRPHVTRDFVAHALTSTLQRFHEVGDQAGG